MQNAAQISDVRILEPRHTFASLLVFGSASLETSETSGRLLGRTQIGSTSAKPT
jgi:hypothetical protein